MRFVAVSFFLWVASASFAPSFGQQSKTAAKKPGTVVPSRKPGGAASTSKSGSPSKAVLQGKPGLQARTAVASKRRTTAGRKTVQRGPIVSRQAAPTSDRYKEIQQALASRGYLKTEPSGVWDADSMEAMRQFQTDRNLDPSGKLTAAALIDLGLGPKADASQAPVSGHGEAVAEPPKVEAAPAPEP